GLLPALLRHRRVSHRLSRPDARVGNLARPPGHHDVRRGGGESWPARPQQLRGPSRLPRSRVHPHGGPRQSRQARRQGPIPFHRIPAEDHRRHRQPNPRGCVARRLRHDPRRPACVAPAGYGHFTRNHSQWRSSVSGALLEVEGLARRFEGIVASDDIQFAVAEGELHAVIGPNGAGKTTLIGQLAGEIRPNSGWVRFAGRDITALPVHRRSLLGLARSFQITSLFLDFTALDNAALAVQAHAGHSFSLWRHARPAKRLREPALAALKRVGLEARTHVPASKLSHGEHRQLELAMALATAPRMLLLDEPMAGLGAEESQRAVAMLRELKREYTILLVEHDMEAVFALADRITVLLGGRVLASGLPETIRANAEVRRAYLGEQEAAHAFGR